MSNPTLTEPGTKFFLNATLRNCHKKQNNYINHIFNITLLILFTILLGIILVYKSKMKLSPKERKDKIKRDRIYVLNKIKAIHVHKKKLQNTIITNLPRFGESDFEMLHKNYYKI